MWGATIENGRCPWPRDLDGDGAADLAVVNNFYPGSVSVLLNRTPLDTDGDGTPDSGDGCPVDPLKTAPGQCGCGNPDTDTDADGIADCNDTCAADWNGVGGVDSQDFFDFLESFFAGDADFNGVGGTDSQDYIDFLEAFFGGC